jgi:coenzyme F420-reducing hydrogenase beta subunit
MSVMRTVVFHNKPQEVCYGCTACYAVCPKSAIKMESNSEGFKYPQIDANLCVDCGLCEKICPTQKEPLNNVLYDTPQNVFAAWNKNLKERLQSTSGGLFYVIARKWINEGGVVYGVALEDDLIVRHIRVDSVDNLYKLQGSKYVQSDLNDIFKRIKSDLCNGEKVMFSGTPCQVGGLRTFLRKDYHNLLTVDLVCHGTPSPLIFSEHIKYIEKRNNDKIEDFKFRGKKPSGWRAYIFHVFKSGKTREFFLGGDFFSYSFYLSRFNRTSCFSCEYSQSKRSGDITLSDFWNAEKTCKSLKRQRKYGFNLVMCNTPKAIELINSISDEIEKMTLPFEVARDGDVRLRHSEPKPEYRNQFFKMFNEKGYEYLVANYSGKPSFASKSIPTIVKNLVYEIKSYL